MAVTSVLFTLFIMANGVLAGAVAPRQATTTATSTTAGPSSALIETTINGKLTTVLAGPPTLSPSSLATTTTSTGGSSPSSTSSGAVSVPTQSLETTCHNTIDQPICAPHEGQVLTVDSTYWIDWNPTAFPAANTTIRIALQYTNDTSRVAWISDNQPTYAGTTTVKILAAYLDGWDQRNMSLVWVSYGPGGSSTNDPRHIAYNVTLAVAPPQHLPAPPPTPAPDRHSLLIALPVSLGAVLLVVLGLFFGMRSHRRIALGSVMGRGRRGYGVGKSRRERMGGKRAIKLQDREKVRAAGQAAMPYQDEDRIAPADDEWDLEPVPRRQERAPSFGSLVDEDEPNASHQAAQNQNRGR